jgi:AraC-like DNA-binding protein
MRQNNKTFYAHGVLRILLIIAIPAWSTVFVDEDFERGETWLAEAADSGATVLKIFERDNLDEWPVTGGIGVLDYDIAGRKEVFHYRRRAGNTLILGAPLKRRHPNEADIRSAGMTGEFNEKRRLVYQSPLSGGFSRGSGFMLPEYHQHRYPLDSMSSLYIRFSIRFQGMEIIEDRRKDRATPPGYYFCALSRRYEDGSLTGPVVRLWLFKSKNTAPALWIYFWDKSGRHREKIPLALAWDRPYRFDLSCLQGTGNGGSLALAVDGTPVFSREGIPFSRYNGKGTFDLSHNGLSGVDILRPMVLDDIRVSSGPPAPVPATPEIIPAAKRIPPYTIVFAAGIVACQWMISDDNTWLDPVFQSGEIHYAPPYNRLHHNLPPALTPGGRYFLRARQKTAGWSRWTAPFAFTCPESIRTAGAEANPDIPQIIEIRLSDTPDGPSKTRLQKERWMYLSIVLNKPAPAAENLKIHTSLHALSYRQGNYINSGGPFLPHQHYRISMGFDSTLYVGNRPEDIKGEKTNNKLTLFCDDRNWFFRGHMRRGRYKTRIRLLEAAESGPWAVESYVWDGTFRPGKIVPIFKKRFILERTSRSAVLKGLLFAAPVVLLLLVWLLSRRRKGDRPALPLNLSRQDRIVKQGIDYIENHLDRLKSTVDIANALGISDGYFRRLFKEAKKQQLVDYINERRIEKAKILLKRTDKNITDVMFEVGFKDPSYFTKIFRKYTGSVPSKYTDPS